MTVYQSVKHGGASVGIGMVGSHPQCEWLLGWLKDHLVRDPRLKRSAIEAAQVLAGLVAQQWPDRPFYVEVERKDRLGVVRVEEFAVPAAPSGPVRN